MKNFFKTSLLFSVWLTSLYAICKPLSSFGQSDKAEQLSKELYSDSTNITKQYQWAEFCRINYAINEAEKWYSKVNSTDPKGLKFEKCLFWLATTKKRQQDYKTAAYLFKKYASRHKNNGTLPFVNKAISEIKSCYIAAKIIEQNDPTIQVSPLNSTINTADSETSAQQIGDSLFFTRLTSKKNIGSTLFATKQSNTWNKVSATSPFPEKGISPILFANKQDTTVYFSSCEHESSHKEGCTLYASKLVNTVWQTPQPLPSKINHTNAITKHPALGYINKKPFLFFSSNRPEGEGMMDIWLIEIKENGTFGNVTNAGKSVNSPEDDISPYFCNPCQTLYFSSTWHPGLGGFDVFKSKLSGNSFTAPHNVGAPINSQFNDTHFSLNTAKTKGYFSSNRQPSKANPYKGSNTDIFTFAIPGATEESETTLKREGITTLFKEVSLFFHNDEPDPKSFAISSKTDYETTYNSYTLMRDKYINEFTKNTSKKERVVSLAAVNTFFTDSVDAGMNQLKDYAAQLSHFVKEGRSVTIVMKAYCSPLGNVKYNLNLAKRRMDCLNNYFIQYNNGILAPYISANNNESTITIKQEFIGENEADGSISDDFYDTQQSIYNPKAAAERKITFLIAID